MSYCNRCPKHLAAVVAIRPFEWGHVVGTQEAGWPYRWTAVVCCSALWNIPTPIDQVMEGRVVQTHVKIDALCEQQWEEIQVHVTPAVSPRTIGNACLQQDSEHVCFLPGHQIYHDTTKHGYYGVMLSSVMRVLYVSDGHTSVWHRPGELHLPECIHPRHRGPHGVGDNELQLTVTSGVSAV